MNRPRAAEAIAEQLETMIVEGALNDGDRLPAERALAEKFGVSRPTLREAIQSLQSKGLLETRPGGGTTVKAVLKPDFVDPLMSYFNEHPESRFDVLEARHSLEGDAAWHAAIRATDEDKILIRKRYQQLIEVHESSDPMAEAQADAQFHLSIVEASHNLVLLHIMRGLFELLRNNISHNLENLYLQPKLLEPLREQHHALMQAVIEGEPEKARLAAQNHLAFVGETIQSIDEEQLRKTRSLRRLTSLDGY